MSHPVVARMESADPDERRAACREAATDPSAVLLLEALCERLGDAEKAVVRAASDAIVAIERNQPGQADALLRAALHGDSARRRWGAAFTRARLSPPEPGLIPAV
ncbi:MAG: HEAT repeat domain-containing protein, partial [Proteobacteria bacterium]|nr:HEAT repeat domain-containing protein [Pseudomonadota bacterium]